MCFQPNYILDLSRHSVWLCTGKVYFIDDRKHFQVMVQGQINICQSLGFNSLSCIHHQDRPVASGQASGHLIIKIHMSRSVNKVENVFLSVSCLIHGPHSLSLDGNSPLPLQIHIVQHLGLHLPAGQEPRHLDNSVCKG